MDFVFLIQFPVQSTNARFYFLLPGINDFWLLVFYGLLIFQGLFGKHRVSKVFDIVLW